MNEPKIEFKKVKTFQGMEGQGLNAEIYVNGVKCFFMRDAGDGGMIDFDKYSNKVNLNEEVERNVQLVDKWIAQIPAIHYPLKREPTPEDPRTELVIEADYETYFNDKYEQHLRAKLSASIEKQHAKFEAERAKLFQQAIVMGNPATPDKIQFLDFKKPLSAMPLVWLQVQVNNAKAMYIKGGIQILNKKELEQVGVQF